MKNIILFIANLLAVLTTRAKIHSFGSSIGGQYSYGKRDFMGDGLFDGEIRR